jgi:hypothetical protein
MVTGGNWRGSIQLQPEIVARRSRDAVSKTQQAPRCHGSLLRVRPTFTPHTHPLDVSAIASAQVGADPR